MCELLTEPPLSQVGFPGGSVVKNLPTKAEDMDLISGSGRSPGEGNGNPLKYSFLENQMDRGAWRDTFHGVARSQTWLRAWAAQHTLYTHEVSRHPRTQGLSVSEAAFIFFHCNGGEEQKPSSVCSPHDLRHHFHWAQESVRYPGDFHKFFCLNHPGRMILLATKKSLYYTDSLPL